jgi:TetR/AcrR family transcriptional regulator, transcriptional repressor for nem operon
MPKPKDHPRSRKNDPEGVRNRILDAAAELFHNQGYSATGMQAIFESAGVTSGAFYHHFEGKKELGLAVVQERIVSAVDDAWMAPIRAAHSTVEGVTQAFKGIAAELEARHAVRGCPLNNLTLELAHADAEFQVALQAVFDAWTSVLESRIRQDVAAGVLPAVKPSALATYIVAVYSGAMTLCKVQQSAKPLAQCLVSLKASLAI